MFPAWDGERGAHHDSGGVRLLLRHGDLAHGLVDVRGLVVEVLHAPQGQPGERARVGVRGLALGRLCRHGQEHRLVLQSVQVLVGVRDYHLRTASGFAGVPELPPARRDTNKGRSGMWSGDWKTQWTIKVGWMSLH